MYDAPFVSGKDSLNNEYIGADGQRHAVPPTLVITAVAHVPDADHCVTPVLAEPGNVLVLLGTTDAEFAGSHLDLVLRRATQASHRRPTPTPRDVPPPPRGDPSRAGRGRATTSARAASPSRSPRCASPVASAPRSHAPPRRPRDRAVQRVAGPARRRGAAGRARRVHEGHGTNRRTHRCGHRRLDADDPRRRSDPGR